MRYLLSLLLAGSFALSASAHTPFVAPSPVPLKYPDIKPNDVVVFAGDSITALGAGEGLGYPGWQTIFAQQVSVPNVDLYNSGVPGNTSTNLLQRFNSTVLYSGKFNPTVVVIWIGINDIDIDVPVTTIIENIEVMVNAALRAGAREVVLVSPIGRYEFPDGDAKQDVAIDELTYLLYALSAKPGVYYCPMRAYRDYVEALANPLHLPNTFMMLDGLHPNQRGMRFVNGVFCATFGIPTRVNGL